MRREGHLRYALVTPARNEADHIALTLESVISQTRLPVRWIIVSDGSTDGTDDIVRKYSQRANWLELVRLSDQRIRSFAAKVDCFNAGFERIKYVDIDVIGSLDADISFEPDYFEFLLEELARNERLGVAGTPFVENGHHYDYRFTNVEHVSGACQLFRRECFEEIGGYMPIEGGGIDWVAVTTARMKGWQTRSFTDKACLHHRPMGSVGAGKLRGVFRHGKKDYYLGGHPLWQFVRCAYQMTRPPVVVGGLLLLAGYIWAWLSRVPRPVGPDLVRFHRAEQMARLRAALSGGARG